VNGFFLDRTDS